MASRTFRNDRTNATITSTLSHQEAFDAFLSQNGNTDNHWILYWIHKYGMEAQPIQNGTPAGNRGSAIQFLCDSWVVAIGRGLKRPMIRLHFRDQRFKLYLSNKGTICIKTGAIHPDTKDPIGDEVYMGCLLRGKFMPATSWNGRTQQRGPERQLTITEKDFLDGLCTDPIGFMATCSKDMCRCCYCNQPLEDERSKAIGYGKTCAGRWGLPWGDTKHMEGAPSFAKVHGDTASGLCNAIRSNPEDATTWEVLGDWLEEKGLPRTTKPEKTVVVPRNDSGGNGTVRKMEVDTPVVVPPTAKVVPAPWTLEGETYSADKSDLPEVKPCPCCKETIYQSHLTGTDKVADETMGWRFKHPCGAKLLVIND